MVGEGVARLTNVALGFRTVGVEDILAMEGERETLDWGNPGDTS